jgi:hypothetical protein
MQTLRTTIESSSIKAEYNYLVKALVVILICLLQSPKVRAALSRLRKKRELT